MAKSNTAMPPLVLAALLQVGTACIPATQHWGIVIAAQETPNLPSYIAEVELFQDASGTQRLDVESTESSGCERPVI